MQEWLYCKADWASCFSLRLTDAIPALLCNTFSVFSNDPSHIFPTLTVPVQMSSQTAPGLPTIKDRLTMLSFLTQECICHEPAINLIFLM